MPTIPLNRFFIISLLGESSGPDSVLDQGDLSRPIHSSSISADRLDRLEATLSTLAAVLDKQSQQFTRLTATVEALKTSQLNGTGSASRAALAAEDSFKKSLDSLTKSLGHINGMEPRLTASLDGIGKGIEASVGRELKNQLAQGVPKALKPVGEKMAADAVARLNGLDGTVRQRLDEALRSPQFGQLMAQSVAPHFAEQAKYALQGVMSTQLVGAFQLILNQSLVDLNQTFGNGRFLHFRH